MISIRRSLWVFPWTAVGGTLGVLNQLVIARVLGPVEYGKANVVLGLASTAAVVLSLGFPTLLLREISKNPGKARGIFSFFLMINLMIDGTFLVPAILLSKIYLSNLKYTFPGEVLMLIAAIYILSHVNSLTYSYYLGSRKQPTAVFLRDVIPRIIKLSAFLPIALISLKVSYMYMIVVSVVSLVPLASFGMMNLGKPILLKGFLKDALVFYSISLVQMVFSGVSKLIQGAYYPPEYVGYLAIGMVLGQVADMAGTVFMYMVAPEFAYHWERGERERGYPVQGSSEMGNIYHPPAAHIHGFQR